MNNDANGGIWVANLLSGKFMKIDYKTKQMTLYEPLTQTLPKLPTFVARQHSGSPT